jgi:hypothetical protein
LLDDPIFPLAQPLTVQLHGGAACWHATYSEPASQNGAGASSRFTDKAD